MSEEKELVDEKLKLKMRKEFRILIDRCGCSKACIMITPKEAEELKKEGISVSVQIPDCKPSKCFPSLYKFLYPKGGFAGKSDSAKRKRKEYFRRLEEDKAE